MEEGKTSIHELRQQEQKAEELIFGLSEEEKLLAVPLLEIQKQRNTLYINYLAELRSLQEKYDQLYKPLYEQRKSFLANVPGFWFKALKNNTMSSTFVYEHDEELLQFLIDIKYTRQPNSDNFSLEFEFAENPMIDNKVLKKDYFMANEDVMEKAIGTEIVWKGPNLTQQIKQSKKKGKKVKNSPENQVENRPSFFNFFKNVTMPGPQDLENMDEAVESELVESFEEDFDLAMEFKEEIIPNAVLFYLSIRDHEDIENESQEDKPVKVDGSGTEKQECKQQ